VGRGRDPGVELGEYRARAGALTLSYLSSALDRDTLRAILAQAATDAQLVDFEQLVVPDEKQRIDDVFADRFLVEPVDPAADPHDPATLMQPTPAGRELPFVGATLSSWLQRCPAGPIELGERAGKGLWPLLSGWTSTVAHAVAAGAQTAAEVEAEVAVLDREATETRISILEEGGMLRPLGEPGGGEERRFEPTEWMRLSIAPLAAAARMELRHPLDDTAPIAAADVEAALRLTLPLLRMRQNLTGSCALEVELDEGVLGSPVEMTARIEEGLVVACERGPDPEADASVAGPAAAWLDAVIERDRSGLRTVGDRRLPRALLRGLHETLFGGF